MKFIIFSDVHGNSYALKECLKYIDNMKFDAIIWCGDYVSDFQGSHEVIELIQDYSKKYKSYIVLGNRDYNLLEHAHGVDLPIRKKKSMEFTYSTLTKKDIEWLESLPNSLEIELSPHKKIYVSHECNYDFKEECIYKIFGHTHQRSVFSKNGVRYLNPGSVGIPTDGNVGAEFMTLEIKEKYEKIEEYLVSYDINSLVHDLKYTPIYNDEVKWGKLIERGVTTGFDYAMKCVEEYDKLRKEKHIKAEDLTLWNQVVEEVLAKDYKE